MIKEYRKDADYSYTLGAFPTLELLRNKKEEVIEVIIHSSFNNEKIKDEIYKSIPSNKVLVNDKLIEKLSSKENCYVIGVFKKYFSKLNKEKDHLLLDNPSNMGNLGTIIRSSLGFNITNIAIIKPGVDYFDPKVIRSSMGSIFSVNIEYFGSLEEYIEKYPNHLIHKFMLQAKKSIREEMFDKHPLSLCFGNEAKGIDIRYLDEHALIINHSDKIDSLNVTNAVSIALYEYNEKQK